MEVVVPRPGYTPPEYLNGIFTKLEYNAMLRKKTGVLLEEDRNRKRPWVQGVTFSMYEKLIHGAICAGGRIDPFTGETLRWELTKEYSPKESKGDRGYVRRFHLMPVVDHVDPDGAELRFEICGWLINTCKSKFTPDEFVAICRDVERHCLPES
jgi:hypothetical protein